MTDIHLEWPAKFTVVKNIYLIQRDIIETQQKQDVVVTILYPAAILIQLE